MALFRDSERSFAQAVSNLSYCNPFLPERIEHERRALGPEFREADAGWNVRVDQEGLPANVQRLVGHCQELIDACRGRLAGGDKPGPRERELYEDLVLFLLFHRYLGQFDGVLFGPSRAGGRARRVGFYREFLNDWRGYLSDPKARPGVEREPAHLFACFFQLRRAFHHIFRYIVGASGPIVRLRAAVWQSIFTHDMRRYRRGLYSRMADVSTLITGPSGTGKELVARAVGLSRYIPFDERAQTFAQEYTESFLPINLSALSPTLIESELFGHVQGAFTGAIQDRAGWLEVCPPLGTVFLDEVAEIDPSIQVKLLRVLHERTFQRIGDTRPRHFAGKVIAATNRDMAREMQAGRFRTDLYYRLCSDMIAAPPLREQLADSPDELPRLVLFLARRVAGEDEARGLAGQVVDWIEKHLGRDYPWPGNVRELEQCVRNVLIREAYHPQRAARNEAAELAAAMQAGALTAEQLLQRYCTLVYAQTGSYEAAARRLGLDRRTVRKRLGR